MQRPELEFICMSAYVEYLIVSPGSTSYRSDLRYQWNLMTKVINTITINDRNQLFPIGTSESSNKIDVSSFWSVGNPQTEVLQCKPGEISDLLVIEMASAYHVPMNSFRRHILFMKDPGYSIVIDRIISKEGAHKYI